MTLKKAEQKQYEQRIDKLTERLNTFVFGYHRKVVLKNGKLQIQIRSIDGKDWINAISE